MKIPFLGDFDFDSSPTNPSKVYKKSIIEFTNIVDFLADYYEDNTIFIPLCGAPIEVIKSDSISNIPDDVEIDNTEEGYRRMYDYRLMNPYILRSGGLNVMNVKMFGKNHAHGLVFVVCNFIEVLDSAIQKVPFGLSEKIVQMVNAKYDKTFSNGRGGYLKTVIWIPLYNICSTNAVVVTLFNRINIILT